MAERTKSQPPVVDPYADPKGALHDVSNALTVMLGWVSEARTHEAGSEAVAYALRMIERRARGARDLARRAIGAAPPSESYEQDMVDAILGEVVEALSLEAGRSGVTLSLDAHSRARIHGGGDLSQVVTNIVMNAIAHAPSGTSVLITASSDEENVAVDIEDRGPGVPAPRRNSIFEGDSTRTGGAGVGLPHARAVARASGGEIELVPSVAGACFRITWPLRESIAAAPRSTARELVLLGKHVLLVEDDGDVISLLESALEARGATLAVARTAEQMKNCLGGATVPVAVLVDLSPIASDVAGALSALRRSAPEARLVFITGSATPSLPDDEGIRWVRKPFEVAEIVSAILGRDS